MRSFVILIISFYFGNLYAQNFSVNNSGSTDLIYPITENNIKAFKITHSGSYVINPDFTPLCNNGEYHYENSYYLAYDLQNDFNISGDWIVESIEVAVEDAAAGNSTSQPLIINLHVMSQYDHKTIKRDSLTLIGSDTVYVTDSESGTLKNIDFSSGNYIVSDGQTLVVEFLIPNGTEDHNLLYLGTNNDRTSDSTYIRAPNCGISEPVNVSQILFPEVMLIAGVYGQYASPDPKIQSFTIDGQVGNTEIKNNPYYEVNLVMPVDTALNLLTPVIQIPAGFQITPASGETVDFSQGPVIYTVDNNFSKVSRDWTVNVVNAGPDIIDVNLPELQGEVIINGDPDYTVTIPVKEGSDLTSLSPEIITYSGFTVTPESGSLQDFSNGPVNYTVSYETSLSQDWEVSVVEAPAGIKGIEDLQVQLYPNPASDYIVIKCENFKQAQIFDLNNKLLINTANSTVNLSELASGLYFVRIISEQGNVNKKIIVIK